jgi:hypothetical protein
MSGHDNHDHMTDSFRPNNCQYAHVINECEIDEPFPNELYLNDDDAEQCYAQKLLPRQLVKMVI